MAVSLLIALRWLALAITVAGAIPVRICTCGASLHLHNLPPWKEQQNTLPLSPPVTAGSSVLTEHFQPWVEHDPDCHLVRPRPLMAPGVLLPPTEIPHDTAVGLSPETFSCDMLLHFVSIQFPLDLHPPPLLLLPVPLHLALCQLRN
jgi:hypothetical protein